MKDEIKVIVVLMFLSLIIHGQSNDFIYDNNSRLIQITYPDSTIIEYCYDELGNRTCYNITSNQVTPSDLFLQHGSASNADLCQNSSFTISYSEENLGAGASGGFETKYYLSTDPNLDTSDTELLSQFTIGLIGGAMDSIDVTLTLPTNTAPGSYHVIVLIDANEVVEELSEINNQLAIPINVNNNSGFSYSILSTNPSCNQANGDIAIVNPDGQSPYTYSWAHDPTLDQSSISNLTTGTYYFTITDANGCQEAGSESITNDGSLPSVSFNYTISGDTVFFNNTTANGDSYVWDFGDGATSTGVSPWHLFGQVDVYEVCLEANNACGPQELCLNLNLNDAVQNGYCGINMYPAKTDDFLVTFDINDSINVGRALVVLDDNTMLIVSRNETNTVRDFNISKMDMQGNVLESNTYKTSDQDYVYEVKQDSSGRVFMCGFSESYGSGSMDGWFAELNRCGEIIWSKVYGGSSEDAFIDFEFLDNGNIIIVGRTSSFGAGSSDVWVIEMSKSGGIVWSKTYGSTSDERAYALTLNSGNGPSQFTLVGIQSNVPSTGDRAGLFMSLDSDGQIIKKSSFYDLHGGSDHVHFRDVVEVIDPGSGDRSLALLGFSIAGIGSNATWPIRGFITKVDDGLNILSAKSIEGYSWRHIFKLGANNGFLSFSDGTVLSLDENLNPISCMKYGFYGRNETEDIYMQNNNIYSLSQNSNQYIYSLDTALDASCYRDTGVVNYQDIMNSLIESETAVSFSTMDIKTSISLYDYLLNPNEEFVNKMLVCKGNSTCEISGIIENKLQGICQDESLVFVGQHNNAYSLKWVLNNATVSSADNYQFDAVVPGNYELIFVVSNGLCTTSDTCMFYVQAKNDSIAIDATITHNTHVQGNDGSIDISVHNEDSVNGFIWSNGDMAEDVFGLKSDVYRVDVLYDSFCVVQEEFEVFNDLVFSDSILRSYSIQLEGEDYLNGFKQICLQDTSRYLVGGTNSVNLIDLALFGTSGNLIWHNRYSAGLTGTYSEKKEVVAIEAHEDRSITVALKGGGVAHLDELGNRLWSFRLNETTAYKDIRFFDMSVLNDSVIVCVGEVTSNTIYQQHGLIYAVSKDGEYKWHKVLGHDRGGGDWETSFSCSGVYGNYVFVGGSANRRFVIMKFDQDGIQQFNRLFQEGGASTQMGLVNFDFDNYGNIILRYWKQNNSYLAKLNNNLTYRFWNRGFDQFLLNAGKVYIQEGRIRMSARAFINGAYNAIIEYNSNGNEIGYVTLPYSPSDVLGYKNEFLAVNGSSISFVNDLDWTCSQDSSAMDYWEGGYSTPHYSFVEFAANLQKEDITFPKIDVSTHTSLACPTCDDLIDSIYFTDIISCPTDVVAFKVNQDTFDNTIWLVDSAYFGDSKDSILVEFDRQGTYLVSCIVRYGACFDTVSTTVVIGNPSMNFSLGPDTTICGQYRIQPSIDSLPILWSTGDTTSTLLVENSGTYSARITDSHGCEYVDSVIVVIRTNLLIDSTVVDNTCDGNGMIAVVASGGNAPYNYLWSTGISNNTLNNLEEGNFTVTITDDGLCSETFSFNIEDDDFEYYSYKEDIACYEDSGGVLSVTPIGPWGEYSVVWSSGDSTPWIENKAPGVYVATITHDDGCSVEESFVLGNRSFFMVDSSTVIDTITTCMGDSVVLEVANAVGLSSADFVWSTGQTGFAITVSPSMTTSYSVVYDDGVDQCSDEVVVTIRDDLDLQLSVSEPTCHGAHDGSVSLNVSNPLNHWYTESWSDSIINTAGSYAVTVTDLTTGCDYIEDFQLVDPDPINVQLAIEDVTDCIDNGYAFASVNGGVPPYSYIWSSGIDTTEYIGHLASGFYSITVLDQNNCSAHDTAFISPHSGINIWSVESGSWIISDNWNSGHIPRECEHVILRSESGRHITVQLDLNVLSSIKSLIVEDSVTFVLNGDLNIDDAQEPGLELTSAATIQNKGTLNITEANLMALLCYGTIENNGVINILSAEAVPAVLLDVGCDYQIIGSGELNVIKSE